MKATRKIVCMVLAIVLAALAVAVPASAAKATPLVIVNGFASTPLYANFGTEDEKEVFGAYSVQQMIGDLIGSFIKGCIAYDQGKKDFNAFADKFTPAVNHWLAPLAYDLDGNPVDSTIGFYTYDKPMSFYSDDEKEKVFGEFGKAYAEKCGEDNVYRFSYDWRMDPTDIASELNAFINKIGGKVNVVAISMGSAVMQAYINAYGTSKLNNVVYASPAWLGTSLVGNLFTGHIQLDDFTLENYLVQLSNVSATTHIASTAISWLATEQDLTGEYLDEVNAFLQGNLPRLYSDIIVPAIGGMPGIWSLCPDDYYDNAVSFMFGSTTPGVLAKINAYHNIQKEAKTIVEKGMKAGMNFGIICGYSRQIACINEEYEQSDGVVDVKYASGGATCSRYLKSFNDWDDIYHQRINDSHNHLSWDYKVDASTCMFPEYTWFIKNMDHMGYNIKSGTMDYVMYLATADKQCSVLDTVEPVTLKKNDKVVSKYPQFSMYNTYEFAIVKSDAYFGTWVKRCQNDRPLGDLDDSGAVNTVDARLALQIASKQKTADAEQLVYGDTNENGAVDLVDARAVLCYAIGINPNK